MQTLQKVTNWFKTYPVSAAIIAVEAGLALSFCIWFVWFALPDPLFADPYATVVEDNKGELMGARIAADGQWRFPETKSVPEKFAQSLICFEDKRFFEHSGVDPQAILRAMDQNFRNGEVVSGGSTLSMQVIRLSRKGKPRTYSEKMLEMVLAVRLEMKYSKAEILQMYASHAPFGGNVVGLDAAAWRYYGRRSDQLSWSESAVLAVLPNCPGLIHPGRNRDQLRAKRDRLLDRMEEAELFDSTTCELAKWEKLPGSPHALPNFTPHLTDRLHTKMARSATNSRYQTTIDLDLQNRSASVLEIHHRRLEHNNIHNAAVLILEVETGAVLAYHGNTKSSNPAHQSAVDCVPAERSTGSIMKPFLYALMLNEGEILPQTLIPDVPTYLGAYSPQNYNRTFDGAVPANLALARSLNIPAIRMLRQYGHARFQENLEQMGLTTLHRHPDEYGLSLILGGAEGSLWDFAGMYASMARTLNHHDPLTGKYHPKDFHPPYLLQTEAPETSSAQLKSPEILSTGAIWQTFSALEGVARPEGEGAWQQFASSHRLAWKTGTSYGHRDAWAIGVTPDYVVAVWAGNADGEGRPGLTGVTAAAPILFDLFDLLPASENWFPEPMREMEAIAVCRESGHRATPLCTNQDTSYVLQAGLRTSPCPYHKRVHLDPSEKYLVHSDCVSPLEMVHKSWFVLPPSQEQFYKKKHPEYRSLPPVRKDCRSALLAAGGNMEIVYPKPRTEVFVPMNLDGTPSSAVFEVAHRRGESRVFWHLDHRFLGSTERVHQMALNPGPGEHVLTVVDDQGERIVRKFRVAGSGNSNPRS